VRYVVSAEYLVRFALAGWLGRTRVDVRLYLSGLRSRSEVTVSYTEFDPRIGSVGGEGLGRCVGTAEAGYAEGGWKGALSLCAWGARMGGGG
jgi:hypothetical protein